MNTNAKHKKFSRKNDLSLNKFYSFAPRFFEIKHCPDGEIGRHASLRGWCSQGCASSSLVLGTKEISIVN